MRMRNVLAAAIGAGAAVAVDRAVTRTMPAGFDAAFRDDTHASRIPTWYPAMCAGYDVALGTLLLSDARR